ncbi:peptide deformylase [Patescibacteria group bacterium]|nr:peptide deformylase [Patescibacteria group bacterium]MBU4458762.1 peptide deformylase [Patescibacteria group bacterium]MCG2696063.1 peptide deformylase [Candidatus Portnoybacteria bacterium]
MILKIRKNKNNPILRKKTEPVAEITGEVLNLIKNMSKTMAENKGVGLSANQVGKSIRLFVISPGLSKKQVFINPEIIKLSKKTETIEEGCLSLPDVFVPIERAKSLKIKAIDENGKEFKLKAKDLLARAIQHEFDHLNGILICDNAK